MEYSLRRNGGRSLYVLGGTDDGIGRAYAWIREAVAGSGLADVKTAGIVSRNAVEFGVATQDYVVFVDTPVSDWSVIRDGKSLMVDIAQQPQGQMIYFRGGGVSRAEIGEALQRGVPVTLYTGDGLAPDAARVAKRLEKNPNYVTDGTRAYLDRSLDNELRRWLSIVVVDRQGSIVAN